MIHAESEKRGASEEWEELWVGHGHYGEQSGAKWGWTSQQQPVPPYYPRAPPPVPSPHTPPLPLPPLPLCSVGVTPLVAPQWHHRYLFIGEWWEGETEGVVGRSSRGGFRNQCAYFMGARRHCSRGCPSPKRNRRLYETLINNKGMWMWECFYLAFSSLEKVKPKKSTNNSNTGHCGGFDWRWVIVVVMGAKRAGKRSEKWSIFGSTPALLMLRRCSQRSKTTGEDPPPLAPITNASSHSLPETVALFCATQKARLGR